MAGVNSQIEAVKKEMESPGLKTVVQAVEEFTAERASLDSKTALINKFQKQQVYWVTILDELPDLLPPQVWLTRVSSSGNPPKARLVLQGEALSAEQVAQFYSNLQDQGFGDVSLDSPPSPGQVMGTPVENFTISFSVEDKP